MVNVSMKTTLLSSFVIIALTLYWNKRYDLLWQ